MRKKITIFVVIIFTAILLRFLYSQYNTMMEGKRRSKLSVPPVTVETVAVVHQKQMYEVPARVTSKSRIAVTARINGYLTQSYFKEGDYVNKGQVLFEIEPQEYYLAVERAKAELIKVRAQQKYYDKQAIRSQMLVKNDYIAKSTYDNAIAQRDAYRAQVAYAEMAYRDALRNLSYTKVKAPVSGKVGMIDVTVGNYVTLSSGALTTIYSTRPMYVTFPLEMAQYNKLNKIDGGLNVNRRVEYIFSSKIKYDKSGVQDFRDNKVDLETGTITMRATFANDDDALVSGDFGKIIIYSNNDEEFPIIKTKCIQENQEGKYVYILDKNNIPKLVYIKTLQQNDDMTVVESGISAGDRVITSGILRVIPGSPVRIVSQEVNTSKPQKTGLIKKIYRKILKGVKK